MHSGNQIAGAASEKHTQKTEHAGYLKEWTGDDLLDFALIAPSEVLFL